MTHTSRRSPVISAACAILIALPALVGTPALAAPDPAASAGDTAPQLELALDNVYQEADPKGLACAFFSAGKSEGEFAAESGNVRVIKRGGDGGEIQVTRASICTPEVGGAMNQRALFSRGTGSLDSTTGAGVLRWEGAFTANAYNGAIPWWIENPVLTVASDGSGTLQATVGGKGASMAEPDKGFPLTPRSVTLATFSRVDLTGDTLTITPDYEGVDYRALVTPGDPSSGRQTASAIPAEQRAKPGWGSWPESLVDFHYESGLSTYWHTSGGSADDAKRPLPFTVSFGSERQVAERPLITEVPRATTAAPFYEDQDLTLTAGITGADSIRWESANTSAGPWEAIPGATEQSLRLSPVGAAWNGRHVRVVGVNSAGETASGSLLIRTVAPAALRITEQPLPIRAIEGSRAELMFSATGTPRPSSFVVEERAGDGGLWIPLEGTTDRRDGERYWIGIPRATYSEESRELRVTMSTERGDAVTTEPVEYSVVHATGKPQVEISPATPVDPAEDITITVVGAGFAVPPADGFGSYSLVLGLFSDEEWQPGESGSSNWVATSPDTEWGQLYAAPMAEAGGAFTAQIRVPGGTLSADQQYGVATFLRHQSIYWDQSYYERDADTFTRLQLIPPADAPATPSSEALVQGKRAGTEVVFSDGILRAKVSGQHPGTTVSVADVPGGHLGWAHLGADGSARISPPNALAPGTHQIAILSLEGDVLGWDEVEVPEAAPLPQPGTGPSPDPEPQPEPEPAPQTEQPGPRPEPAPAPGPAPAQTSAPDPAVHPTAPQKGGADARGAAASQRASATATPSVSPGLARTGGLDAGFAIGIGSALILGSAAALLARARALRAARAKRERDEVAEAALAEPTRG